MHAGVNPDPVTGAILTPIYQSTTYIQVRCCAALPVVMLRGWAAALHAMRVAS